jgi:hypothetical protein
MTKRKIKIKIVKNSDKDNVKEKIRKKEIKKEVIPVIHRAQIHQATLQANLDRKQGKKIVKK